MANLTLKRFAIFATTSVACLVNYGRTKFANIAMKICNSSAPNARNALLLITVPCAIWKRNAYRKISGVARNVLTRLWMRKNSRNISRKFIWTAVSRKLARGNNQKLMRFSATNVISRSNGKRRSKGIIVVDEKFIVVKCAIIQTRRRIWSRDILPILMSKVNFLFYPTWLRALYILICHVSSSLMQFHRFSSLFSVCRSLGF